MTTISRTGDSCAACTLMGLAGNACPPEPTHLARVHEGAPAPVARDALPVARTTRRERRIERMRTQCVTARHHSAFRTSGTPHLARPAIWREIGASS